MKLVDRPYDAFISYAHEDMDFAKAVQSYLRDIAKMSIWRDDLMPGSANVADSIDQNIKNSRAMVLIYSKHTRESEWVRDELRKAIIEKNATRGQFRILGIIVDDESVPSGLLNQKCLYSATREISADFGFALLTSFYPFQDANTISVSRDVFVSRSWREEEAALPDTICKSLINSGFRLIGDSKDWKDFDADGRIRGIIRSCGAVVAIVPSRQDDPLGTSEFILKEIETAQQLSIPCLIIADDNVDIDQALVDRAIGARIVRVSELELSGYTPTELSSMLRESWRNPDQEHHGFFATDFKDNADRRVQCISIAERVTGMRCLTGTDFRTSGAQQEIIERISQSLFFIGDLSNLNVSSGNVLIEIGVALGAGVDTDIVSIRSEDRPHADIFMFRGREVKYSSSDADFIANIHAICRRYRRRVFNWEFENSGLLD